jgi:hypothetical protein
MAKVSSRRGQGFKNAECGVQNQIHVDCVGGLAFCIPLSVLRTFVEKPVAKEAGRLGALQTPAFPTLAKEAAPFVNGPRGWTTGGSSRAAMGMA